MIQSKPIYPNISKAGRNKNLFQYSHKAKTMITEQTWHNLRVEYIEELTHQFSLREKLDTMVEGTEEHKKMARLISNSCERCRNYDFLIQSNADKIIH